MALYEFEGKVPTIGAACFVHPNAVIIGDVHLGEGCFIGACAVLRGDFGTISIGPGSNIQDNCVIHCQLGGHANLGENSHVGHGAMIHGPMVMGRHVTVGMGAIILENTEIGDDAVIGAGSVVTAGTSVPPRMMVLGIPGKVIKEISPQMLGFNEAATKFYQDLGQRCLVGLKRID